LIEISPGIKTFLSLFKRFVRKKAISNFLLFLEELV
jgi:hypothetical protein